MKRYSYPQSVRTRIHVYVWIGPLLATFLLVIGVAATWPNVPMGGIIIGLGIGIAWFPIASQSTPYEFEISGGHIHLSRVGQTKAVLRKSAITEIRPARLDTIVSVLACRRVVRVRARGYAVTGYFYLGSSVPAFEELLAWLTPNVENSA